ncbi:MAG: phenylacetate--CoA ligase family protein [Betaproteobacteria bacterium]
MLSRIAELVDDVVIGGNIPLRARLATNIPSSVVPRIQREKFRRILKYVARRSPFYQRRFKELNIDVQKIAGPEDLGDFFTTSRDLRENPIEDFLCARAEVGFETTGTTATTSKRVYFSRRETADIGRDGAVGLYNLGLRPDDRVVDAFDYSFWNAPFTLRAALDRLGCFHVTAAKIPPAEFYDRVKSYAFNVLFVEPSWLVVLTEIARVRGTWPVKFIYTGGENMSEATRRYVETEWNTNVYMGYGQTETFGQIGSECPAKRGYHIDDFNLFCEIVDVGDDGYGELVYTTLSREVMPLIRYRSTDITKFLDEPCTCMLKAARRLAKIRGRSDEMINCGMGNLSPWFFEQLLDELPAITSDWQVGVVRTGNHDMIEFRLELRDPAAADAVAETIRGRVRERIPDSWRNYELKLFEFGFRFAAPGQLRTGRKLRRLVDERMRAWE